MIKIKILSALVLFCLTGSLFAVEVKSNYVTFLLSKRDVTIGHYETSSATGFTSLNKESTISNFTLQLGLEKEFLADKYVSLTLHAGAGGIFGKHSKEFAGENLKYKDKASGIFYSFSGTLNANFMAYQLHLQPFAGLQLLKSQAKYKVTYSPITTESPEINIDYDADSTQTSLITGVRFFDPKVELFSVISLEYGLTKTILQAMWLK